MHHIFSKNNLVPINKFTRKIGLKPLSSPSAYRQTFKNRFYSVQERLWLVNKGFDLIVGIYQEEIFVIRHLLQRTG